MTTPCPLCCCDDTRPHDRPAEEALYRRCARCGLVFLADGAAQSLPIINDDLDRPAPRLLQWFLARRCALLKKLSGLDNPMLLDVGCGSGRFLDQFRRVGPVSGVEISSQSRAYATEKLGLEVFASLEEAAAEERNYDIITFWHSLEHIDDPVAALRTARTLLSKDGVVFISVPNADSFQAHLGKRRWAYYDYPNHLFEFSPSSLTELLARAGLVIRSCKRFSIEYGPFGALQTFLNFLGGPHNYFYYANKRGRAYPDMSGTRQAVLKASNWLGAGLLSVPAALFSLCESAFARGAVVEVAAISAH